MKIQAQRDTYAFRIVGFDWRRHPKYDDITQAKLENGHTLETGRSMLTNGAYGYTIYGPPTEDNQYGEKLTESPTVGHGQHRQHPQLNEQAAQRDAEEHYKRLFPMGTNTGGHDSGVDYSDLNSFKL